MTETKKTIASLLWSLFGSSQCNISRRDDGLVSVLHCKSPRSFTSSPTLVQETMTEVAELAITGLNTSYHLTTGDELDHVSTEGAGCVLESQKLLSDCVRLTRTVVGQHFACCAGLSLTVRARDVVVNGRTDLPRGRIEMLGARGLGAIDWWSSQQSPVLSAAKNSGVSVGSQHTLNGWDGYRSVTAASRRPHGLVFDGEREVGLNAVDAPTTIGAGQNERETGLRAYVAVGAWEVHCCGLEAWLKCCVCVDCCSWWLWREEVQDWQRKTYKCYFRVRQPPSISLTLSYHNTISRPSHDSRQSFNKEASKSMNGSVNWG